MSKGNKISLSTLQFGEISFDKDIIIHFPSGIVGFEDMKRHIIIDAEDCKPFKWLLSVDDPDVGFAIIDASYLYPKYQLNLAPEDAQGWLKDSRVEDLASYLVVTLRENIEDATVNLKAPVIIDVERGVGGQIILTSEDYPIDYPIFREENVVYQEGDMYAGSDQENR